MHLSDSYAFVYSIPALHVLHMESLDFDTCCDYDRVSTRPHCDDLRFLLILYVAATALRPLRG